MKPAFCELTTNACTDARGISLVKIMRFHACAISSADMSLRVSASSSAFTIVCASSGFFKIRFVMVVVRDDHSKFTSKCIHVRRYRYSHRPARYLSVFLVLSTRQLKISTLFILVLHSSQRQILGRPSVSSSIQIDSSFMSFSLILLGTQTKFPRAGFLF